MNETLKNFEDLKKLLDIQSNQIEEISLLTNRINKNLIDDKFFKSSIRELVFLLKEDLDTLNKIKILQNKLGFVLPSEQSKEGYVSVWEKWAQTLIYKLESYKN